MHVNEATKWYSMTYTESDQVLWMSVCVKDTRKNLTITKTAHSLEVCHASQRVCG